MSGILKLGVSISVSVMFGISRIIGRSRTLRAWLGKCAVRLDPIDAFTTHTTSAGGRGYADPK